LTSGDYKTAIASKLAPTMDLCSQDKCGSELGPGGVPTMGPLKSPKTLNPEPFLKIPAIPPGKLL
jgi:hypothetical protein